MDSIPVIVKLLNQTMGPEDSQEWLKRYGTPIVQAILEGREPYQIAIEAIREAVYPKEGPAFMIQLWTLVGLFSVSVVLTLLGIVLRLRQGRFWLFRRIDCRITMPNISVHNSFWAFVYHCLSIVELVITSKIVSGSSYPSWYISFQCALPLALFAGQVTEVWATFGSSYIRKFGSHHDDPLITTILYQSLPFMFALIALVPSFALLAMLERYLNAVYINADAISTSLGNFSSTWVPGQPVLVSNLEQSLQSLIPLVASMRSLSQWYKIANSYIGCVLGITSVLYISAAVIEITHLRKQVRDLRQRVGVPVAPVSPRKLEDDSQASPTVPPRDSGATADVDLRGHLLWAQFDFAQASLVEWAAKNRFLVSTSISIMLLSNTFLSFRIAFVSVSIIRNTGDVQAIALIAAWVNSVLSFLVATLILFRSLEGSNALTKWLRRVAPYLPLPPTTTTTTTTRTTNVMTSYIQKPLMGVSIDVSTSVMVSNAKSDESHSEKMPAMMPQENRKGTLGSASGSSMDEVEVV
ncbi:BQ5605_C022g09528 [Microbotryum silenes-dioicae]|uniref:BQ5605_C022g09528 protein n=1 Tax=Microbotryum silenes-dioicae TaxID=796604 RepID=A0A2X0MP40_9BASI|nr:BQ5605_C022g09528 [Microbotryum silenes-dioicae]